MLQGSPATLRARAAINDNCWTGEPGEHRPVRYLYMGRTVHPSSPSSPLCSDPKLTTCTVSPQKDGPDNELASLIMRRSPFCVSQQTSSSLAESAAKSQKRRGSRGFGLGDVAGVIRGLDRDGGYKPALLSSGKTENDDCLARRRVTGSRLSFRERCSDPARTCDFRRRLCC